MALILIQRYDYTVCIMSCGLLRRQMSSHMDVIRSFNGRVRHKWWIQRKKKKTNKKNPLHLMHSDFEQLSGMSLMIYLSQILSEKSGGRYCICKWICVSIHYHSVLNQPWVMEINNWWCWFFSLVPCTEPSKRSGEEGTHFVMNRAALKSR